ncbi:VOC family protein [Sulfitobacter sp. D35]|uniref:VOC family protein n=1 Tax=Sulfitobacter sp. D35 TaxID=3083252 RepID=UPI00296FC73E|nr:VOC family protein [Sulfitobacter sp. D35]MDW4498137.1 VOC family protein [Sulfitobacter sp. D35]
MTDRPSWMAPGRAQASTFIVVPDAMRAVNFAKHVFGATETSAPLFRKNGALWNAELRIGDSTIMFGDAQPGMERPGFVYVHVPDVDATYRKALAAGAKAIMEPEERFYGDRDGGVEDATGNLWWISTHTRDLTADEIAAGARAQEEADA